MDAAAASPGPDASNSTAAAATNGVVYTSTGHAGDAPSGGAAMSADDAGDTTSSLRVPQLPAQGDDSDAGATQRTGLAAHALRNPVVLRHVFSNLTTIEMVDTVTRVCKQWRAVLVSPASDQLFRVVDLHHVNHDFEGEFPHTEWATGTVAPFVDPMRCRAALMGTCVAAGDGDYGVDVDAFATAGAGPWGGGRSGGGGHATAGAGAAAAIALRHNHEDTVAAAAASTATASKDAALTLHHSRLPGLSVDRMPLAPWPGCVRPCTTSLNLSSHTAGGLTMTNMRLALHRAGASLRTLHMWPTPTATSLDADAELAVALQESASSLTDLIMFHSPSSTEDERGRQRPMPQTLAVLATCTGLTTLRLEDCAHVQDSAAAPAQPLTSALNAMTALTSLEVSMPVDVGPGASPGTAVLRSVASLRALRKLHFSFFEAPKAVLMEVLPRLTNLTDLSMYGVKHCDDDVLAAVADACPHLAHLRLPGERDITDAGMMRLATASSGVAASLRSISIEYSGGDDRFTGLAGVSVWLDAMTGLERLSVLHSGAMAEASFTQRLPALTDLCMWNSRLQRITGLEQLPNLIHLAATLPMHVDGWEALTKLEHLEFSHRSGDEDENSDEEAERLLLGVERPAVPCTSPEWKLPTLPSVKKLELRCSRCTRYTSPQLAGVNESLMTLTVSARNLEALELPPLPNLKYLHTIFCENLTALTGLGAESTPRLRLIECEYSGLRVVDVGGCPALKDLLVYSCEELRSVCGLDGCASLERLMIGRGTSPHLQSLHLPVLPALNALSLVGLIGLTSIAGLQLEAQPALNAVVISPTPPFISATDVDAFPVLASGAEAWVPHEEASEIAPLTVMHVSPLSLSPTVSNGSGSDRGAAKTGRVDVRVRDLRASAGAGSAGAASGPATSGELTKSTMWPSISVLWLEDVTGQEDPRVLDPSYTASSWWDDDAQEYQRQGATRPPMVSVRGLEPVAPRLQQLCLNFAHLRTLSLPPMPALRVLVCDKSPRLHNVEGIGRGTTPRLATVHLTLCAVSADAASPLFTGLVQLEALDNLRLPRAAVEVIRKKVAAQGVTISGILDDDGLIPALSVFVHGCYGNTAPAASRRGVGSQLDSSSGGAASGAMSGGGDSSSTVDVVDAVGDIESGIYDSDCMEPVLEDAAAAAAGDGARASGSDGAGGRGGDGAA